MKIALSFMFFFILGLLFAQFSTRVQSENEMDAEQHQSKTVELGAVRWERDFQKGKELAVSRNQPLFLLFQEVPGCLTCRNFGDQPLSHPLIVEAIEDLFVPVAVFNNQPGIDAQLLKKFDEAAWNNPVVRYLRSDETDLIPRRDGVWSIEETVERMIHALIAAGHDVPIYLRLASTPLNQKTEQAEFAMHCFWEGEAKLGGIDGVLSTRAGWRDGLEVVQVVYVPQIIDFGKLVSIAKSLKCASKVFVHTDQQWEIAESIVGDQAVRADGSMRDAKRSDQNYYLSHSVLRHLPLTPMQATKINSLIQQGKPVDTILSPRQLVLLRAIQSSAQDQYQALRDMMFPADQNQLASYQDKLVAVLRQANILR